MRSLRSRTIEDKSGSSDADISKSASKISKKKYRNRKSRKASRKPDSCNDSPETSSDILNNSGKSIELNKTKGKTSRRTRNVKRNSYQEESENSNELNVMKQFMALIEKCNDEPHSDLDKEELPSGSFLKSSSSGSSFNQQEISAIVNLSSPNNVSNKGTKIDDCLLIDDDSSEANNEIFEKKNLSFLSKHIEEKSYNRGNCEIVNRSGLWNAKDISCELNEEDAQFSEGFSKNETSNNTINKNLLKKNCTLTDDSVKLMNETFETQNHLLFNKETTPNKRDTFQIKNRSGQWNVEDIINISDEVDDKKLNESSNIFHSTKHLSANKITLHPKRNLRSKLHNLDDTFDTPSKSNRKKWVKFQTQNSTDSPLLRKITYSGLKSTLPLLSSSPIDKKQENGTSAESVKVFQALKQNKKESKEKSFNILNSNTKSNKKSGIKPTTMPNFALIHQKAFEKMESLKDYSERKKLRAKELMSSEKLHVERNKENKKSVVKSSQALFGSSQTHNKFGFKLNIPKPNSKKLEIQPQVNKASYLPIAIRKPMSENVSKSQPRIEPTNQSLSKPQPRIVIPTSTSSHLKSTEKPVSVFSKGHYMAIANKSKINEKLGNRNNRRDQLKGVRTNRRFELLMQMRNNS